MARDALRLPVIARREELRMTQREAADRAGIKHNTLLYLEQGKQRWTVDLITAVADVLELTPGLFFPQIEPADEMELAHVTAFRRGGWPAVLQLAARTIPSEKVDDRLDPQADREAPAAHRNPERRTERFVDEDL